MSGLGKRARYGRWIARTAGAAVAVALTLAADAGAELEPCEVAIFRGPDPQPSNSFGGLIASDGDVFVVCPNAKQRRVYVYRLDGGEWSLEQELLPNTPTRACEFPSSVAVQDDLIVRKPGQLLVS